MATIDRFEAYGERFRFKPPIEIGDNVVESLGHLAAIGSLGEDGNLEIIEILSDSINTIIEGSYHEHGVENLAEILVRYSSRGKQKRDVSIE